MTPVPQFAPLLYEPLVRAALAEDFGLAGDLTSEATIPAGTRAHATFVTRAAGVLAGLDAALYAIRCLDAEGHVRAHFADGARLTAGAAIAVVECDARALLGAERTALNILGHLSGIATATAAFVAEIGELPCLVTETRKTLPGLRALEKYAVRCGGGANHRLRLDDAVLIKDNHIALAGGIVAALEAARRRTGHLVKVEIEVDSLAQLEEVLGSPYQPDAVLLDNFSLAGLREAVRRVGTRFTLEASGGISLATVRAIAETGVGVVSVGALTHSVAALDIGLDIVAEPAG